MSDRTGDVRITAADILGIGEPVSISASYELPKASCDMAEMLEKASAIGVPVPLKMWANAAGMKDIDALLTEFKAEFQAAEKDPLGGWIQTRNELEKSLEPSGNLVKNVNMNMNTVQVKPRGENKFLYHLDDAGFFKVEDKKVGPSTEEGTGLFCGGIKVGAGLSYNPEFGTVSITNPDDSLTTGRIVDHSMQSTVAIPNDGQIYGLISDGSKGTRWEACSVATEVATSITASNLTLSAYQLPYLKDHKIEDLTVPYVEAKSTTRLVRVDMEAAYWAAFKGIAEALDGRHLRFQDTDLPLMAAEGYHSGKCMVLASDVKIQTYTIHEGARELSLRGLLVPVEFLD